MISRDALLDAIITPGRKLGLPGFERFADDQEYEEERSRSTASHILNEAVVTHGILSEMRIPYNFNDEDQTFSEMTVLKRPRLKRACKMTDTISKQHVVLDSIYDDMEKARHNKSGLIQMNLLIDKVKNGNIKYQGTRKNSVLLCSQADRQHNIISDGDITKGEVVTIGQHFDWNIKEGGAIFRDVNDNSSS